MANELHREYLAPNYATQNTSSPLPHKVIDEVGAVRQKKLKTNLETDRQHHDELSSQLKRCPKQI